MYSRKIIGKEETLRNVYNIYCLSDNFFTSYNAYSSQVIMHIRKFHRPHQCTL